VLAAAQKAGFDAVMLATYADTNGRAMFQTLRFVRLGGASDRAAAP
jgi:hypothetical protein